MSMDWVWTNQSDITVVCAMSWWIIMPPLTVVQREINSHSSPPLSHRKPTIMDVVAAANRTMRIQFRRGMGRDGQAEREREWEGEHAKVAH